MHGVERAISIEATGQGVCVQPATGVVVQEEDRCPVARGAQGGYWLRRGAFALDECRGQIGDGRSLQENGRPHGAAERFLDREDNLRSKQRVAAEVEEVVLGSDRRNPEDSLPDLRQLMLGRTSWRDKGVVAELRRRRGRQSMAMRFARRREGLCCPLASSHPVPPPS